MLRRGGKHRRYCYPTTDLLHPDMANLERTKANLTKISKTIVPPRDARCFDLQKGHFLGLTVLTAPTLAIECGPLFCHAPVSDNQPWQTGLAWIGRWWQVGTWRCWHKMWPIHSQASQWYRLSSLLSLKFDPRAVHTLSAWLCIGRNFCSWCIECFYVHRLYKNTYQYFMKASPVRPRDFTEFFAGTDSVCGLSACPGGDCSSEHSPDSAVCHPLLVEIFNCNNAVLDNFPYLPKSQ